MVSVGFKVVQDLCAIFRGIEFLQGFLGSAKRISSAIFGFILTGFLNGGAKWISQPSTVCPSKSFVFNIAGPGASARPARPQHRPRYGGVGFGSWGRSQKWGPDVPLNTQEKGHVTKDSQPSPLNTPKKGIPQEKDEQPMWQVGLAGSSLQFESRAGFWSLWTPWTLK